MSDYLSSHFFAMSLSLTMRRVMVITVSIYDCMRTKIAAYSKIGSLRYSIKQIFTNFSELKMLIIHEFLENFATQTYEFSNYTYITYYSCTLYLYLYHTYFLFVCEKFKTV